MMFNLRHIQLIVVLTDKDEKSWEKFHDPNVFFADGFVGQGGAARPLSFGRISAKIGFVAGAKLASTALAAVDEFDARAG